MPRKNIRSVQQISAFVILSFFALVILPTANAGPLKPAPGEFTVVMVGVDFVTGELIFEGSKTGALPGFLTTRTALTRETGVALHLATRWTLTTTWGEVIEGENSAVLNTESLHFREHGVIVNATGDQAERIGNFVVIHGEISDVDFIPGVTEATAHVKYVPSKAKKYQ